MIADYPEPEWTAENMNRTRGDTTFESCGWCEYCGGGACRHGCALSTTCRLLTDYDPNRERLWDSPCIVKMLGKLDADYLIDSKQRAIDGSYVFMQTLTKHMEILRGLGLADKPPLPDRRLCEYYTIGDIVFVYHEEKWNRGTVVSGYRHNDGCVSYVLDDYPESRKGWGCGCAVPCVLKEWEFNYFIEHMQDFNTWLALSDREYNGNKLELERYKMAMIARQVELERKEK